MFILSIWTAYPSAGISKGEDCYNIIKAGEAVSVKDAFFPEIDKTYCRERFMRQTPQQIRSMHDFRFGRIRWTYTYVFLIRGGDSCRTGCFSLYTVLYKGSNSDCMRIFSSYNERQNQFRCFFLDDECKRMCGGGVNAPSYGTCNG